MPPAKLQIPPPIKPVRDWDSSILNSTTVPTNKITNTTTSETAFVQKFVDNWRCQKAETLLKNPDDTIIAGSSLDEIGDELLSMMHSKLAAQPSTSLSSQTTPIEIKDTQVIDSPTKDMSTPLSSKAITFLTTIKSPLNHETPNHETTYSNSSETPPNISVVHNDTEYSKLLTSLIIGQQEVMKLILQNKNIPEQNQQQHQSNLQYHDSELEKMQQQHHLLIQQQKEDFKCLFAEQEHYFKEQLINQKNIMENLFQTQLQQQQVEFKQQMQKQEQQSQQHQLQEQQSQ
jgi:hypothetical protein